MVTKTDSSLIVHDGGTIKDVLDTAKPIANYAVLRAYIGSAIQVRITGNGIAGFFYRDDVDTTSADNGGTIIVSSNGKRWKRIYEGAVNVKWFGAKGNGTDNDTAQIQAAVDSFPLNVAGAGVLSPKGFSNGGRLLFPRGRYKITATITLRRGIQITGESRESTQILSFTAQSVFKYIDLGRYIQDEINISNLSIWQDPTVTPTSGAGIEVFFDTALQPIASVTTLIENIIIEGTFRGILLGAGCWSTIKNVDLTKCITYGVHIKSSDSAIPPVTVSTTSTSFISCYSNLCGGDGYRIEEGGYCSFISCASDSNLGYGYYFKSGTGHSLIACGAEVNALGGLYAESAYGMFINIDIIDKSADKHGITLNNSQKITLVAGSILSATSSGYGVYQSVNGQAVTCVGTAFQSNFNSNKTNTTYKFLDIAAFGGLVGGKENKWSIGAVSQPEEDATFGVTGVPDTTTNYLLKTYGAFTGTSGARNAALFAQAGTANTAVTYPLLVGGYFPAATKGASSVVQRCAGLYLVEQTVGTTSNANIMIDAGSGTVPAGNWAIYSESLRESVFKGAIRVGSNAGTAPFLKSGTGSPEGVITAPVGSIYMRNDGSTNTTLYVKEIGTGNTGWVAK